MTRLKHIIVITALIVTEWSCDLYAQSDKEFNAETFSFEIYHNPQMVLPFRQAVISHDSVPKRLILYLHGGTSKGNDNTAQMKEPGIDSIGNYLSKDSIGSVIIIPQCPSYTSWTGRMTEVLKSLVEDRMNAFNTISDVYLFGGSMGGTGTWAMISNYPGLFSAAMPVAGDPSKCDANNVARTPLYTVMGTEDRIMNIENVTTFINQLEKLRSKYIFDVEKDWTHEDTCTKSYTTNRLHWVFSNTKQSSTSGLIPVGSQPGTVIATIYRTLFGVKVDRPAKGVYIVQQIFADSSIRTSKIYIQ